MENGRERQGETRENETRTAGKEKAWIVTERAAAGLVIINSEKRIAVKARLSAVRVCARASVCARGRTRILIDHLRLHGASRRCTSSFCRGMIPTALLSCPRNISRDQKETRRGSRGCGRKRGGSRRGPSDFTDITRRLTLCGNHIATRLRAINSPHGAGYPPCTDATPTPKHGSAGRETETRARMSTQEGTQW